MKSIFLLLFTFVTTVSFAQKSFYEALDAQDSKAIYQLYGEVYKGSKGKQEARTNGRQNAKAMVEVAYFQTLTKKGSSTNVYTTTSRKAYNAKSKCKGTVVLK